MAIRWGSYKVKNLYDELLRASSRPRPAAQALASYLRSLKDKDIERIERDLNRTHEDRAHDLGEDPTDQEDDDRPDQFG